MPHHTFPPIDYLVIGHLACDRTPQGNQLGGTAAYAALTADALGQRTGIITATGRDLPLTSIQHLPRAGVQVEQSTTFENVYTSTGRTQTLHHHAQNLTSHLLPALWQTTPVVHFGPIVHEIDTDLLDCFPASFVGLTPQGWLRQWDGTGRVSPGEWPDAARILSKVDAAVLSVEDVAGDEKIIEEMANVCRVFVVTEGARGARLFVNGAATRVGTLPVTELDATGAGDIFAAAFFIHLQRTGNPFEAARDAGRIAACSVTRPGLAGIPTLEEIQKYWELTKNGSIH